MFERRHTTPAASTKGVSAHQASWSPSPSPPSSPTDPASSSQNGPDIFELSDQDRIRLLSSHANLKPSDITSSSSSTTSSPLVVLSPDELEAKVKQQQQQQQQASTADHETEGEQPIELWEELANALLWTIPFAFLFTGMDYAVHAQYGQQLDWSKELGRLANVVPSTSICGDYDDKLISPANHVNLAFGVSLIDITSRDSYLNVMARAPGLGTLWVWTVVKLDLVWALIGLSGVAMTTWYKGQWDAFKPK
ncbi:hypothetical protein OIO90_004861 [Microbotryomycetes sp. JL221]|nr:hypothetical protein OIO90_004861 [Microbotryomycetes sp. JL221]